MESSDDSFTWANTSNDNDTEDSDTMVEETILKHNRDDTDSGVNYKKKLQKRLFGSDEPAKADTHHMRAKKKKVRDARHKTRVKLEFDSDGAADASTSESSRHRRPSTADSVPSHDSYLDLRVKQEEAATAGDLFDESPRKRKKQRKCVTNGYEIEVDNSSTLSTKKSKKIKRGSRLDDTSDVVDSSENSASQILNAGKQSVEKTQNRRNFEVMDMGDMIIEDKFCAEETMVETPHRKPSTNDIHYSTRKLDVGDIEERLSNENKTERKQKKINAINCYTSKEFISDDSSDESTKSKKSEIQNVIVRENNNVAQCDRRTKIQKGISPDSPLNKHNHKSSPRNPKLSDRITFEDEVHTDVDTSLSYGEVAGLTSQFRCFLKANPNLKSLVSKPETGALITQDDDIWVIRCPYELDIRSLINHDLLLDNKCKLKIDGHTYNGCLDEEQSRVAILSFDNNQSMLKSIPLMGTLNLRKRIPKPHFLEDNVMVNNQTDFIPLPDTKRRHPLFGADFKRAMKIPASVKVRLRAVNDEPMTNTPAKKKKKRAKEYETEPSTVQAKCVSQLESQPRVNRKCKKRKIDHTIEEVGPTVIKLKRFKYDLASEETWESEKAIEESLFRV